MLLPRAYLDAVERQTRPDRDDVAVLVAWAVTVLGLLASFDLLPAAAAGLLLTAATAAGAVGMLLYLQRPATAIAVVTPRLLVALGGYHVLVLLLVMGGAVALFGRKPALLGTVAGLVDAAPAVTMAVLLWRRAASRRAADGWA